MYSKMFARDITTTLCIRVENRRWWRKGIHTVRMLISAKTVRPFDQLSTFQPVLPIRTHLLYRSAYEHVLLLTHANQWTTQNNGRRKTYSSTGYIPMHKWTLE